MALIAGLLWSVATTGIRTRPELRPADATFVFAVGAALAALALIIGLDPAPTTVRPQDAGSVVALALVTGGVWWGLSIAGLMWATVRLEPARVGILLMTEVLIGAASAAVLAGERLSGLEIVGGALVLVAGVLEVWPVRRAEPPRSV